MSRRRFLITQRIIWRAESLSSSSPRPEYSLQVVARCKKSSAYPVAIAVSGAVGCFAFVGTDEFPSAVSGANCVRAAAKSSKVLHSPSSGLGIGVAKMGATVGTAVAERFGSATLRNAASQS